jgi:hypothetical protein
MKSSTLVLALATACGPGFTSGTYEGKQDGGTMVETTDGAEPSSSEADVSPSQWDAFAGETSLPSDAAQGLDNDAHADARLDAPAPVVCNGVTCPPCGLYACCSPEGNCGCFYSGCWD